MSQSCPCAVYRCRHNASAPILQRRSCSFVRRLSSFFPEMTASFPMLEMYQPSCLTQQLPLPGCHTPPTISDCRHHSPPQAVSNRLRRPFRQLGATFAHLDAYLDTFEWEERRRATCRRPALVVCRNYDSCTPPVTQATPNRPAVCGGSQFAGIRE